jgi:hypothetical protein
MSSHVSASLPTVGASTPIGGYVTIVERSYDGKARWKGVNDRLIERQKDFKGDAKWTVCALIAHDLSNHFSFGGNLEKRFVEYCERWKMSKSVPAMATPLEFGYPSLMDLGIPDDADQCSGA